MANEFTTKIAQSKAAGYTESEILDFLIQDPTVGNKIKQSRESGYSDSEILNYIGTEPATSQTAAGLNDISPQKSTVTEEFIGDLPMLAGGLLGGFAKTAARRIPSVALLAGGGEAAHQLWQRYTGDPNTPKTWQDAMGRILWGGGTQAIGQGTGELGLRVLSLLSRTRLNPFKIAPEYVVPEVQQVAPQFQPYVAKYAEKPGLADKALDAARQRLGLEVPQRSSAFTLGQQVEPQSFAAKLENIAESSFFGGGVIKHQKYAEAKGASDFATKVSDDLWASVRKLDPSEQGKALTAVYDAGESAFKKEAQIRYTDLDKKIGMATVDLTGLKATAQKEMDRITQFKGIGSSEAADNLHKAIANLPDTMTFSDLAELRSRLLKTTWSAEGKDVARMWASKYTSAVDNAMESTAKRLSPNLYKEWRETNQFYKAGMDKFENEYISKLIDQARENPSRAVNNLTFKSGSPETIAKVKEIADPQTWQQLKTGWIEGIIAKAKNPDGSIKANTIFNQLKTAGGKQTEDWWNSEMIKTVLSPQEITLIKSLDLSVRTAGTSAPGGGCSMLIQLIQAGPLAAAVTLRPLAYAFGGTGKAYDADEIAEGLAILFAPRIMAKMLVDPKYQKFFLQGMSADKPRAIPAIMKLIAGAANEQRRMIMEEPPKQVQGVGTQGVLE